MSARRSICPVACALDLVGDRWTLLVVRDLFAGKNRFQEFSASPERIATNILAERLRRLVEHDFVTTEPLAERAGAVSYHLTPRGAALLPILEAIRDFGLAHIPGTEARIQPRRGRARRRRGH